MTFACFNGLLWKRITLDTNSLPETSTFKVTSVANGHLLTLNPEDGTATGSFQRLF
jgi:hypothetical protein